MTTHVISDMVRNDILDALQADLDTARIYKESPEYIEEYKKQIKRIGKFLGK